MSLGISSERLRYTWTFDLSDDMGFRQVPLNVDKLIVHVSHLEALGGNLRFYGYIAKLTNL